MKIGVLYPSTELEGVAGDARRFATAVEQMGFDHVSVGDHVLSASHDGRDPPLWGPYDETDRFHDPFVLLAFMAAVTKRLELATSVVVSPQRQTVLMAKQAADVALLSEHRLRLALGVGWSYVEYAALGRSFSSRGRRLGAQIEMLRALWSGGLVTAAVDDEVVDRAGLGFRPGRPIPIWIGGASERALRRGALEGDGFCFAGDVRHAVRGVEQIAALRSERVMGMDGYGLDLVLIPPPPERGAERWPKVRPAFLDGASQASAQWQEAGGTHVTIMTTWMGLRSLDEHLDYADKAMALLRALQD